MKTKFCLTITLIILGLIGLSGCDKHSDIRNVGKYAKAATSSNLPKGENEIAFSKQSFFYPESIQVEILSNKPCKIYYTTDGTDPDQKQKLYENGIKLTADSEVAVTSVKAKAYFDDGATSKVITHTYFVGKNVNNRFDTLVFSVTTDPYNLYDYEYGIFVEGKLRDDYIKTHPYDKIEPDDPANYNMRGKASERKVYLEIMTSNGTKVASQEAGIRTYGAWSRANSQKSIKIYTRKEYDEKNNKLKYEFFPAKTAAKGDGSPLNSFNRLVLRNCGNDNGFGFIRDELFQTLAGQAGYKDYEAVRPAALFINGEYRGFYWLHEVYDDEYFDENYGKYKGEFSILEGGELFKNPDDDGSDAKAMADYDAMYAYAKMDLTNENNYNKLCKLLDVDNYLSYYALQIYIGNEDWPWNNYKTYRYYPAKGEALGTAPFDGKWRYLLHDLDFSFGIYGTGPKVDNIDKFVGPNGEIRDIAPLFGQLMKRKDCKELFIKKTCDLINGAFAPSNLNSVLDDMNDSRLNELKNTYGKGILADWMSYDQLSFKLNEIRNYGVNRSTHIIQKYQQYFKLGDIYTLNAQPAEGCKVKINSYTTNKYFSGSYYTDYKTNISAVLPKGKKLDYWLVNGSKVYSDKLVITSKNIVKDGVEVTFVTK